MFGYNSAYDTVLLFSTTALVINGLHHLRDILSSRTPLSQGGALDLSDGGVLSVSDSTFGHNSAAYGGAVGVGSVGSEGVVQISGSSFHNHSATAMVGEGIPSCPAPLDIRSVISNFPLPLSTRWRDLRYVGERS